LIIYNRTVTVTTTHLILKEREKTPLLPKESSFKTKKSAVRQNNNLQAEM
jgi:hypothetical protein